MPQNPTNCNYVVRTEQPWRVDTAYVSASGCSLNHGFTEIDAQEARVKRVMLQSAERVVALLDASKFGVTDASTFATLDRITEILTDDAADQIVIDELLRLGRPLTICGEWTVTTCRPHPEDGQHYRIDFANLSENHSPFAVEVRHGLECAARAAGNVDLVLADNQLDGQVALNNADHLIAAGIELAIEYQIDEKVGNLIMEKFRAANIPVIAVDIPMVGATFFGVENYRAGQMAGVALGQWVKKNWRDGIDRLILLEEYRAGSLPAARIRGQLDGFQEVVGPVPASKIVRLDSDNTSHGTEAQVLSFLAEHPAEHPNDHRVGVICFNDDAAIGAINASRQVGREVDIVVVGQGMDRRARAEIRDPLSRLIGSTAYWPDRYGEMLIDAALKILRGEQVPPAVYLDHVFISADNLDEYYPVSAKPQGAT